MAKKRRRPRRAKLKGIVRDYILEHAQDNPEATSEETVSALGKRFRDDFEGSPWLEFLLKLLELLAPILIPLLLSEDGPPQD